MKELHEVLISVVTYSTTNKSTLESVLIELKKYVELNKSSAVYSVTGRPNNYEHVHEIKTQDSFQGLCVALRGLTEFDEKTLMKKLNEIIDSSPRRIKNEIKIYLLVYENITTISPSLTLPFPDFHIRPELIVPASDIWGEYVHPILDQTLNRISKQYQLESWGDFYSQNHLI